MKPDIVERSKKKHHKIYANDLKTTITIGPSEISSQFDEPFDHRKKKIGRRKKKVTKGWKIHPKKNIKVGLSLRHGDAMET